MRRICCGRTEWKHFPSGLVIVYFGSLNLMSIMQTLAKLPMESIQQDTWGDTEPILYLLLGIGFLLTLIVGGVFVYIMTRKGE
jgi:hypothetical protein